MPRPVVKLLSKDSSLVNKTVQHIITTHFPRSKHLLSRLSSLVQQGIAAMLSLIYVLIVFSRQVVESIRFPHLLLRVLLAYSHQVVDSNHFQRLLLRFLNVFPRQEPAATLEYSPRSL